VRRLLILSCLPVCALAVSACATSTSTSNFKGAQHEVAQTVANLQSDVTGSDQKKICTNDLAATVVTKLGGSSGCQSAIKGQLTEIDNTELNIESVKVTASTAIATVKNVYKGKKRLSKVELVKEGGKWKIAALR
jgi:hypothetical protein